MLAMTWPAIAAVLAGLSENSSLPDRVSVTPTSGPSRRPFYGLPRWVTWWATHHRSQDIAGDVEVVGQAALDQVGGPGQVTPIPATR
jgi:hypothetical protein